MRRPLVLVAVTGAQRASRMQFVYEKNRCSPDLRKREMAVNAGSALSFWNLGFNRQPRSLPVAPETPSSAVQQMSVPEVIQETGSRAAANLEGVAQLVPLDDHVSTETPPFASAIPEATQETGSRAAAILEGVSQPVPLDDHVTSETPSSTSAIPEATQETENRAAAILCLLYTSPSPRD